MSIRTIALSVVFSLVLVGFNAALAQEKDGSSGGSGLARLFQQRVQPVHYPTIERLEAELRDIASRPEAQKVTADELEFARKSLDAAFKLRNSGRDSDAERSEQTAEAALVLASRKIALEAERAALRAAERNAIKAEREAERAKEEIEAALRKRTALIAQGAK
jgi:hypothetical protein